MDEHLKRSSQLSTSHVADVAVDTFAEQLGLRLHTVTAERVLGTLEITARHHQPMGIVHGGVYCSIVEAACSMGALAAARERGSSVVGLDNQTSFLKATRAGVLTIKARPLVSGRSTQFWEAEVHNEQGQLVATGRVRLLTVHPERLGAIA